MTCPGCEYEIFTQDQSDVIDTMRKAHDTEVTKLVRSLGYQVKDRHGNIY
jgi:hypothetical protein